MKAMNLKYSTYHIYNAWANHLIRTTISLNPLLLWQNFGPVLYIPFYTVCEADFILRSAQTGFMSYQYQHIRIRNIYTLCQVNAWQSATLLPIRWNSAQSVPARVKEPVGPVMQSSSGDVTNNLPWCLKPTRESRLSKLVLYYQCVFRRRRRTR